MSLNLRIFTLNCWGLAVVSKDRKPRMHAIADLLASSQFDVVCLQEVWTDSDYNLIREKCKEVLPYSHYFYSGVTGSGICIMSKHLIEETFFHQWSVNGYIHKLQHGDWWAGKGVGLCRLKVVEGAETFYVNVYSAHLHAEYNRASDDYQAHRVLQAYDTAQFILLTSGMADLVVLAGDLNTEPGDLSYRVILSMPGLTDAYMQSEDLSEEMYATCENCKNSYTPSSLVKKNILGKRIDYVMYHPGLNVNAELKSYTLPLPTRVPKQSYSYSDHEAILVELAVSRAASSSRILPDDSIKSAVLEECIMLCKSAMRSISRTKVLYWFGVMILFPLLVVTIVMPAVLETKFFDTYPALFNVLRVLVTILIIFCFLMATLWSKIEMHGVKSGKLAMEVSFNKIKATGTVS
ncbi:neutral sphingomyelinase [Rhynchophorus ferrugineus]|uniref:sphingomyelin phosphodiesterase n=1 Tax=Rhynchophorus ferrugineus TaxID=354439 RepID=A0A834IQE7_RHYFE|nr:hypothetical protein GWI33_004247 [Rhynchophorus ferrugineus]